MEMGGVWGNFEPRLNHSSRMRDFFLLRFWKLRWSETMRFWGARHVQTNHGAMPRNKNSRYYTMLTAVVSVGMCHDDFSKKWQGIGLECDLSILLNGGFVTTVPPFFPRWIIIFTRKKQKKLGFLDGWPKPKLGFSTGFRQWIGFFREHLQKTHGCFYCQIGFRVSCQVFHQFWWVRYSFYLVVYTVWQWLCDKLTPNMYHVPAHMVTKSAYFYICIFVVPWLGAWTQEKLWGLEDSSINWIHQFIVSTHPFSPGEWRERLNETVELPDAAKGCCVARPRRLQREIALSESFWQQSHHFHNYEGLVCYNTCFIVD